MVSYRERLIAPTTWKKVSPTTYKAYGLKTNYFNMSWRGYKGKIVYDTNGECFVFAPNIRIVCYSREFLEEISKKMREVERSIKEEE